MPKKRTAQKRIPITEITSLYDTVQKNIESRLGDFDSVWKKGAEEDIFAELAFCLLTPQSKAKSCHDALCGLLEMDLLLHGRERQIAGALRRKTRFHNNKARNIVEARKLFSGKKGVSIKSRIRKFGDPGKARDWLVDNVRGMGLKEASHFLRNIGMGEELAILDRHILKNLELMGVIDEVPGSLTKRRYLDIEEKMRKFSGEIGIPLAHLDLLLWYKETGEVFK